MARVLVAGIGGASLGTEIIKCLRMTGSYDIFGCDISPLAFGHYEGSLSGTCVVPREGYLEAVLDACQRWRIQAIVPGGEEPLVILGGATEGLKSAGVHLASNSAEVIETCSNKDRMFARFQALGVPMPKTWTVKSLKDAHSANYTFPCVVKPATGTGGSAFVTLAGDKEEALLHLSYLIGAGRTALVQEYLPVDEGEYTVGALSLPDGRVASVVGMRRLFHTKLSVQSRSSTGLISTGYSQGLIQEFPELADQVAQIARALGSVGPMNVQGRVRNGLLYPFEVNPRFSASSYLRALAGCNEVDVYLQYVLNKREPPEICIRPGYYLRSFSETFVPLEVVIT